MLRLVVQLSESFDEDKQEFVSEDFVLELEHSLVSLSKWESEFEKPFLDDKEKTSEEAKAYVLDMILTPNFPPDILDRLSQKQWDQINDHISAKKTATWFNEPQTPNRKTQKITSELIYYWMTSYQIPWEAENWHLNRLFTLIRVFNANNSNEKTKKRSPQEIAAERRALNEKRKAELKTKG